MMTPEIDLETKHCYEFKYKNVFSDSGLTVAFFEIHSDKCVHRHKINSTHYKWNKYVTNNLFLVNVPEHFDSCFDAIFFENLGVILIEHNSHEFICVISLEYPIKVESVNLQSNWFFLLN